MRPFSIKASCLDVEIPCLIVMITCAEIYPFMRPEVPGMKPSLNTGSTTVVSTFAAPQIHANAQIHTDVLANTGTIAEYVSLKLLRESHISPILPDSSDSAALRLGRCRPESGARPTKRQRQLRISHIYSRSYLLSSSTVPRTTNQMIKDRLPQSIEQFVQCQKAVDPLVAQRSSRMDMITVYLFEPNNGANFIELEDERNVWRAKDTGIREREEAA